MNDYERYQGFVVPQLLIKQQSALGLTDRELIVLIQILTYQTKLVTFNQLASAFLVERDILAKLKNLQLVDLLAQDNEIYVSIEPLFTSLYQTKKRNHAPIQPALNLTADALDRISFLLNRQIKNFELESLKKWLEQGYQLEEIEVAIQKSVINNVDNFNYIETVLINGSKKASSEEIKVERNIEFY